MGLEGKLNVEVEVKSPAEKVWQGIMNSAELFPKIFPEQYKSIDIVQGDGNSVGSVRLIKFAHGIPLVTFVKEKIEAVDEPNMTLDYSVVEGDLLNAYKSFKAKLQVAPKGGEGALVKWGIEYEKASEEVPEPDVFKSTAVKTFSDLDAYLLKN